MLALMALPSFLFNNWKLIVAGIAATAMAIFVYSWDHRGQQVAILGAQNAVLQSNIKVMNKRADLMRSALTTAADRMVVVEHDAVQFNQITEEAARAPETDNAPIAPVLRHGLDSLVKLLQPGPGPR